MSSSPEVDLRLEWCSYRAAKYAVEHWHYSHSLPVAKTVRIGVWEQGSFRGCIVFAWGANKNLAGSFGLRQTQCAELARVALREHVTPVSRIVSLALKMLKKQSSGLRLVVSYADTGQDHYGGIYQAGNWTYQGKVNTTPEHFIRGHWVRQRTASSLLGSVTGTKRRPGSDKHKYVMPLDPAMRQQIAPLAKPYPKRGTGETDSAPQSNAETGGAGPTVPLLQLTGQTPRRAEG